MFKFSRVSDFLWILFLVVVTAGVFFFTPVKEMIGANVPLSELPVSSQITSYLLLLTFNAFLFFGIKEFFRKYSRPFPNAIIMVCGVVLVIVFLRLYILLL